MLALLVEGRLAPARAETVRGHLGQCPRCLSAYTTAVEHREEWLLKRSPEAVPEPSLAAAKSIPTRALSYRDGAPPRTPPRARLLLPAVAGAAVLALIVLILRPGSPTGPLTAGETAQLRAAVEAASARGMVIPGGEGLRESDAARVYRSGNPVESTDVETIVQKLAAGRSRSADETALKIASLVALGKLAQADALLPPALEAHPQDPRFPVLAGIVAYRSSRLNEAEKALRRALALDPREATTRFDLGLILQETGHAEEARVILEPLLEDGSGELPARRAREELIPSQ